MSNLNSHDPLAVTERLAKAWNDHDIETLAELLHADYESINPLHPERNFWGREDALRSWRAIFEAVPDFHAKLIRCAVDSDGIWTEWQWRGAHVLGQAFNAGGVIVFGLDCDQLRWARVYTEIVQTAGLDWDLVLENVLNKSIASKV
ncbi:MAG: nuclear transport factor 2 family protein [Anaerolineales bacterium]